ncbi:hypothetical protein HPP92_024729 [Vanilla planifolia]|uniref:Tail specific protease domain-containing protein n=1 Tax=Vanilla planifolia TaxID=51239 RepID=A0A835UBF6_VANPL|nr:hypothetical protein HPP92_024729 [Vanilla planifolia]
MARYDVTGIGINLREVPDQDGAAKIKVLGFYWRSSSFCWCETALNKLHQYGATYLVLDLRNNLGGLVQAGIEVAKLFLDQGETVIYTAGRNSEVQNTFIAEGAPFSTNKVIILVNNKTASASEIVASALRDNCKAVLVGEKTYGKGLIQSVYELRDGSGLVVTIGKYITPGHKDINGNGIEPDFSKFPGLNEVRWKLDRCELLRSGLDPKPVVH